MEPNSLHEADPPHGVFLSPLTQDYRNETETHRTLVFDTGPGVEEVWAVTQVIQADNEEQARQDTAAWAGLEAGIYPIATEDAGGKTIRLQCPKPPPGHVTLCRVEARASKRVTEPITIVLEIVQGHGNAQGMLVHELMRYFDGMLRNPGGKVDVIGVSDSAVTFRVENRGRAMQVVLTAVVDDGKPILRAKVFQGDPASVTREVEAYTAVRH